MAQSKNKAAKAAPKKAEPKAEAPEPEPEVEAPEPEPEPEPEVEGDADRIVEQIEQEDAEAPVVFVGTCDKLFLVPPRPRFDSRGDRQGMEPGLEVDFQGIGHTRAYFPGRKRDAEYIAAVREQIADGHPDVLKYDIREQDEAAPLPPIAGWERLSLAALSEWVAASLGDDHDENVRKVREYARYELARPESIGGARREVLAMLDSVVATEAPKGDAFEVEVSLSGG